MEIIEMIAAYSPVNEQEEIDKEIILDYLKSASRPFSREDKIAHITVSAWIVNETFEKVLFAYHKIYDSWAWVGGHADEDCNLLRVAIKEAKEETGISKVTPYNGEIFSLETLSVNGHIKSGKYVPSHLHLNITFLLIADENQELCSRPEENLDVKWFPLSEVMDASKEEWIKESVYKKLIQKTITISKNTIDKVSQIK